MLSHWWEHTVEIFCQNFFLSRWSERLQTICVRVALQLLQLLHLQDFCLSATQWDKTFPDNSYSSGNMHVQFFLVNISTRHQAVASPNIFPSHSEWWDWPGRSRCKNAKAQRNCGENNSLGLAFRNICSCQLPRDVSNCHGLRTWLDFGVFGEKYKDTSRALSRSLQADLGLPGAIVKNIINFLLYF